MREHFSHPLILSASHSGSMPLLSALPFDPCLMRVLDHQYSNYITWKRGKTRFLSSLFLQCSPSVSLMLSFLMHCLCFLFSPAKLILKSFTICIWYTCFLPLCSAIITIFPCAHSESFFFKVVHHLFNIHQFASLLPTYKSTVLQSIVFVLGSEKNIMDPSQQSTHLFPWSFSVRLKNPCP